MSMNIFRLKTAAAAIFTVLVTTLPAKAQDAALIAVPSGATKCDIYAWTSFSATKPIPVHAKPDDKSTVLGRLPVARGPGYASVEFMVIETSPGWLKIEKADDPAMTGDDGKPLPKRKIYKGTGWIRSDQAQIAIQSGLGYSEPRTDSQLIMNQKGRWVSDMARITRIRACSGRWVLVDYKTMFAVNERDTFVDLKPADQKIGRAWFRGICSDQYTTCDMRDVDSEPTSTEAKL